MEVSPVSPEGDSTFSLRKSEIIHSITTTTVSPFPLISLPAFFFYLGDTRARERNLFVLVKNIFGSVRTANRPSREGNSAWENVEEGERKREREICLLS